MLSKLWITYNSGERGYLGWLSQHTEKPWQGRRRVQYSEHGSEGVCQILCPVPRHGPWPATALITERLSGEGKGSGRLGQAGEARTEYSAQFWAPHSNGLWHIWSLLFPMARGFRLWKPHKRDSWREEPQGLVWRRVMCGTIIPIQLLEMLGWKQITFLCVCEGEN